MVLPLDPRHIGRGDLGGCAVHVRNSRRLMERMRSCNSNRLKQRRGFGGSTTVHAQAVLFLIWSRTRAA